METVVEGKAIYKTINEKMGETVFLSPITLHLSEYNTRSTCIDLQHVEYLAERINERGFHPKRAISVNVIRGVGGTETTYRVAAGVHRFEASKKAGLGQLPCLLYYDLTEEEECLLDKWDNEMDEDHKPINFLDEAEHYRYLYETKGWSYRKIGKNKNVDHKAAERKIKIAKIPEEAKRIIRGVDHGPHLFSERHFRDICELSEPHIIAICEEIATRGRQAEKGEKDQWGRPVIPMRQTDIKKRVDELLKLEKDGKELTKVKKSLSTTQLSLFSDDTPMKEKPEECYQEKLVVTEKEREDLPEESPSPSLPEKPKKLENLSELAYRCPNKNSKGLNLDRCVRWLKNSGLIRELGQTAYIVLRKMEEYDLWYRANQDEPFFFALDKDPFALIAEQAGVEREHLQKRSLPFLKKEGFVEYWMDKGLYWFKLNWDKLFEVYLAKAHAIPFDEDGLENIQPGFSGVIRPTPFHYIRLEKGLVVPWNDEAPRAKENEHDPLAQALLCLKPPMGNKEILFCVERRPETETALKLIGDMEPGKRKEIKNEAAYVLQLVRRGASVPNGFVTPQEARDKEEGERALAVFLKTFYEKKYTRFCPKENVEYEILTRDNGGFAIEKGNGQISYCHFKDWMDPKFFR